MSKHTGQGLYSVLRQGLKLWINNKVHLLIRNKTVQTKQSDTKIKSDFKCTSSLLYDFKDIKQFEFGEFISTA